MSQAIRVKKEQMPSRGPTSLPELRRSARFTRGSATPAPVGHATARAGYPIRFVCCVRFSSVFNSLPLHGWCVSVRFQSRDCQ